MKFEITSSRAAALVALIASVDAAQHGHGLHHARFHEARSGENNTFQKKNAQCQFPTDAGLVAVTPNEQNAGWAMSPDQPCKPGNYCPYACPPGQVSMQWDPKATSYTYPMSMVSDALLHLSYVRGIGIDSSYRTVVSIVMKTATSRSLFQTRVTVNQELEPCKQRTRLESPLRSARLCCLVMRLC